MSDLRLKLNFSGSAFVGKAKEKNGRIVFTGNPTDVTTDFIAAMVEFLGNPELGSTKNRIVSCSEEKFVFSLTRLHNDQDEHAKLTETQYGFKYGPVEVTRIHSGEKFGVMLQVSTEKESVDIRSTPSGLLRVFSVKKVKK